MAKLGELFPVTSGGTPSRKHQEYYQGGTIPWVKTGDLKEKYLFDTDEKITNRGLENSSARLYPIDTVLLAMYGATIGAASILKIEAATNQACAAFEKCDNVLPEYLYAFLESQRSRFIKDAVGGAQPNISAGYLKQIDMPLLPLDEQCRIAAVLDKVSGLIAKRREQLDKLDELVKARFVEMFGDETEFDRWPSCTIGDVADICVGVVIKPTQYYADHGIPAFRSLNIGEMRVKDGDWVYFTKEGHQKNQKSVVRKNDVLVVRSGAPGTACVASEKYDGYNAVDIIIAHPDNTKVDSTFLAAFTNMPHGMNQIRGRTGGAAQQHFNVGGYKTLRLIMPPIDQQQKFASFVKQTDKSKLTIQQSLDKLEVMKKALMQQYFG